MTCCFAPYCPQSIRYDTGVTPEPVMEVQRVVAEARHAKAQGATRFCMGAAWRRPKQKDLDQVIEQLKQAGLDYYNHNIDSSPEFYEKIITTRTFAHRMDTLRNVMEADINVCSGGIVGMGESRRDRAGMLRELANLPKHPGSVPINMLVKVPGTPLADAEALEPIEFVRTIAVARLLMPRTMVRLSAGRTDMSEEMQAMCFFAGANSIFYGEKLLTTENPGESQDMRLLGKLGIRVMSH